MTLTIIEGAALWLLAGILTAIPACLFFKAAARADEHQRKADSGAHRHGSNNLFHGVSE